MLMRPSDFWACIEVIGFKRHVQRDDDARKPPWIQV